MVRWSVPSAGKIPQLVGEMSEQQKGAYYGITGTEFFV